MAKTISYEKLEKLASSYERRADAIRLIIADQFKVETNNKRELHKAVVKEVKAGVKPHWTQTPEGRAKASRRMKAIWKATRQNAKS